MMEPDNDYIDIDYATITKNELIALGKQKGQRFLLNEKSKLEMNNKNVPIKLNQAILAVPKDVVQSKFVMDVEQTPETRANRERGEKLANVRFGPPPSKVSQKESVETKPITKRSFNLPILNFNPTQRPPLNVLKEVVNPSQDSSALNNPFPSQDSSALNNPFPSQDLSTPIQRPPLNFLKDVVNSSQDPSTPIQNADTFSQYTTVPLNHDIELELDILSKYPKLVTDIYRDITEDNRRYYANNPITNESDILLRNTIVRDVLSAILVVNEDHQRLGNMGASSKGPSTFSRLTKRFNPFNQPVKIKDTLKSWMGYGPKEQETKGGRKKRMSKKSKSTKRSKTHRIGTKPRRR